MNKHKEFIKECYDGKHGSMCADWKAIIENHYPEFKEEQFNVGDWVTVKEKGYYDWRSDTVVISRIEGDKVWSFNDLSNKKEDYTTEASKVYRKATKEEIEAHLIAEAKRRGFKRGVVVNASAFGSCWYSSSKIHLEKFEYIGKDKGLDQLSLDDHAIYKDGKWAEIIETITKEEAEKQLGKKIV